MPQVRRAANNIEGQRCVTMAQHVGSAPSQHVAATPVAGKLRERVKKNDLQPLEYLVVRRFLLTAKKIKMQSAIIRSLKENGIRIL